jgi:hypothetical protein
VSINDLPDRTQKSNEPLLAYATVESDIFKPTKYGGKYTVTLIPGTPDLE